MPLSLVELHVFFLLIYFLPHVDIRYSHKHLLLFQSTFIMEDDYGAQDVARCRHCATPEPEKYCDFCHVNLCKLCVGEHIGDAYDKHKIVPFQHRKSTLIYPRCETHENEACKYQCKDCDSRFVCYSCTASAQHKGHEFIELAQLSYTKKESIREDLDELEYTVFPKYEEITSDLENQIANLDGEYERLTIDFSNQLRRQIDAVITQMEKELRQIKLKHLELLRKHLDEIKPIQELLQQTLVDLNKLGESNKVSSIIAYTSENARFREPPPTIKVTMPKFIPKQIKSTTLQRFLGELISFSVSMSNVPNSATELLDEANINSTIETGYAKLRHAICSNKGDVWASGETGDIKCFRIDGVLAKTIKTNGNFPAGIAVDSHEALVYSDGTRSLSKVKNGQREEVCTFQGWRPTQLCITSIGDFLVSMFSDDEIQSKIVRVSGSTEKQTIQYDDDGLPLYSGNSKIKCLTENRNLDICVADSAAGAVVVVNENGALRFRYNGHSSPSKTKPFRPFGITTDSQGRILTADHHNNCIHILNENGQFLCYIDKIVLESPYGVCVDKNDNLYVCEYAKGNLKIIKYTQ